LAPAAPAAAAPFVVRRYTPTKTTVTPSANMHALSGSSIDSYSSKYSRPDTMEKSVQQICQERGNTGPTRWRRESGRSVKGGV
jgi:hypothetical protein